MFNTNDNTKLHNYIFSTQGELNRMMQYSTILTAVVHSSQFCHLTIKPPYHSHHETVINTVATFCKLIMTYWCTFQKHHITVASFIWEIIFLGILWVRTKNSEWLTQENTLKVQYIWLRWVIFWDHMKSKIFTGKLCIWEQLVKVALYIILSI